MPLMIYCTAALTSFSDSISYITFSFLEWRIHSDWITLLDSGQDLCSHKAAATHETVLLALAIRYSENKYVA